MKLPYYYYSFSLSIFLLLLLHSFYISSSFPSSSIPRRSVLVSSHPWLPGGHTPGSPALGAPATPRQHFFTLPRLPSLSPRAPLGQIRLCSHEAPRRQVGAGWRCLFQLHLAPLTCVSRKKRDFTCGAATSLTVWLLFLWNCFGSCPRSGNKRPLSLSSTSSGPK